MPSEQIIVFDLETVTDLPAYSRAEKLDGLSNEQLLERIGDTFPKPLFHQIACIGALIAERSEQGWRVRSIDAPHCAQSDEKAIIEAFLAQAGSGPATLVSFNGHGFDLPVLRYRAMLHGVSGGAFGKRSYFDRYSVDSIDLCDVLASFDGRDRIGLDALCRVMGLKGKPESISGKDVEAYVRDGRIEEVAAYCETDVVNTYRLWLRFELFSGRLGQEGFGASEDDLRSFVRRQVETKPHLQDLV